MATPGKNLAALKLDQVAIGQRDVKTRDVGAHGTIGVAASARGIACRHTAQAGRRLGGIGGKELLGGFLKFLVSLKRSLVPVCGREHLLAQLLAQLGQHDARLYAKQKATLLIAAKA